MIVTKQFFSRGKSDGHLARVLSVAMLPALVASLYKALYLDPNLFAAINLVVMYAGLTLLGWLRNIEPKVRTRAVGLLYLWLAIHVVFRPAAPGLELIIGVIAGLIWSSTFAGHSKYLVSFIPVFMTVTAQFLVHSPPVLIALQALLAAYGSMLVAVALIGRLNDESQERQAKLELVNKELSEKSKKQEQMFAIIGHELRTPLSSMKMMEDAMELRNIGEYGANICDSTDAVLNIVDDLRTVINPDKVHEAQAVVDSPFDVLNRTTRSLEGLYEQQGVEVILSSNQLSHSLCMFNAQALRQKITNLTKNAAIHADADRIWVDLQAQPKGDDKIDLTLIVEDNGKGIPEGLREAVFGAFSRGNTRADGTGLGLYITRELAEKLGGTVEYFESEKGGAGFRVEFTLDLHLDAIGQEQEQEQELDETAIPAALQDKRILFAEDQKTLQLLTGKQLKDAGADVVVCDNGKQALEACRAGEFDIVLTDLMMPEMSGDELIRHVRADGFTGPVVALTAAIIGKETDTLLEAGADAVLNKPLEIQEMKRTIAVLENKVGAA